jgi:diguanylate cyclase (GGDEF)-like protein/PAS domain S-box-containing protein
MHLESESNRLDALSTYDLRSGASEPGYSQLADLGAQLFNVPICLVSIVGEHHQWFKGRHGLAMSSTPRSASFCTRMLSSESPLVVLDAAADPAFRDDPLVTGQPHIRFYAGAPLIDSDGVHLGSFCIIDTSPRPAFSDEDEQLLVQLAAIVLSRMEKRRRTRLAQAVQCFASASKLALLTADADGRITFWNNAAAEIFGRPPSEAIGRSLDILFPERCRNGHGGGITRIARGATAKLAEKTVELVGLRRNGEEFPLELRISSWQGAAGREFGAQVQDISQRRQRELTLQYLDDRDALTGLTSGLAFRAKLTAGLSERKAVTLLTFDLDGLKQINDAFGYPVGDALLQAIAVRLNAVAGSTENTLARLGSDAFALMLPGQHDPSAARATAMAMLTAVREPFVIGGHLLQVGLSIGVAMAPLHATEADELMLRADLALLAAKKAGGRQFQVFDIRLSDQLAARRAFKSELRRATDQGEWELFYQPQMRLDDGALIGAEALLRWRHPTRGLLTPAAFLGVLEGHPVAYEVGSWVVDEACRQLAAWRRSGWDVPRVSVNLFAAQFSAGTVEQVIRAALERHALHPDDLEIEITETIALRPDDQTAASLLSLRQSGVHIAFDDFGTGFASLTTLK